MKRATIALLMLVSSMAMASMARQKSQTGSEAEQVWAQEEAYWRYVKTNDAQHWTALWSDDFVGWPAHKEHPMHREEGIAEFKAGSSSLSHVTAYRLHRESVEKHGPVVITFYRVTFRTRQMDGSESTHAARLTHTWMKHGSTWLIVGGMSAPDSTPTTRSAHH